MLRERERQDAHHRRAVLEDVRDAARDAEVVLEDVVDAVAVAHEIAASDHATRAVRHRDAARLAQKSRRAADQPLGDDAVAQNRAVADVQVLEKLIQRRDALNEAALDERPFGRGDDARDEIHRPHPLDLLLFPIDGERDAEAAENRVAGTLAGREFIGADRAQSVEQRRIVDAYVPVGSERFVEKVAALVRGERVGRRPRRGDRPHACGGHGSGNRLQHSSPARSLVGRAVGLREQAMCRGRRALGCRVCGRTDRSRRRRARALGSVLHQRWAAPSSLCTSSVTTRKRSNVVGPNDVVSATSTASRPRAINTRPMRR